ncbi:hypothetical protein vBPpSSYP_185 [Pseudomonas phage vB_PpS_SYP]|nr:hypothetical protein vBPpSSYP_185 [Pseudomonas phage vB_PpS_SYP]
MSNLHSEIMNIPARSIAADEYDHKLMAYKCGHRDARHDAAELSLKYDQLIEMIEDHYGSGMISIFKRKVGI